MDVVITSYNTKSMRSNEDEYIEQVLSKFNNKLSSKTTPLQVKRGKKDLVDMQSDLTELRNKLNEQSGYILEMTKDRDDFNYIERIRKDNMLLYQTNEELRLIIRELQIKINDIENDMKSTAKSKNEKNGFKTNRDLIAIEAARNEEKEKANEMLNQKDKEIKTVENKLKEYEDFVDELKSEFGITTDKLNIEEYLKSHSHLKQRMESLEQKVKSLQQDKEENNRYIEKMNQQLNLKNTDFSKLESENSDLNKKITDYENKVQNFNNQMSLNDINLRELREENNRLKEINNNLSNKILELQEREASERNGADELRQQIRILEDQIRQLNLNLEHKNDQHSKEVQGFHKELNQLRVMLKDSQNQHRDQRVYNAPSSLTTSNVESINQTYKPLYEKTAEEKRKVEEELRALKMKYDSEIRTLDINNRNLLNDKNFYSERLNRLQTDYNKLFNECSELKATQRKNSLNVSKVNEEEYNKLKANNDHLNQENNRLKATLEFFQHDNERLKRELNELKSKQRTESQWREVKQNNTKNINDFQTTLQTYITEKEQQIKETNTSTPCKIYQMHTRYEKSPNITRYTPQDNNKLIESDRKITRVSHFDKSDCSMQEVDYLRSEITRQNQRIRELTETNNQQINKIYNLSQQLNEVQRGNNRIN